MLQLMYGRHAGRRPVHIGTQAVLHFSVMYKNYTGALDVLQITPKSHIG